MSARFARAVRCGRTALARVAGRSDALRRLMERAGAELTRAAAAGEMAGVAGARPDGAVPGTEATPTTRDPAGLYGGAYFGEGRDPGGDRQGRSGYATYDRTSSNADIAAFCLYRHFRVRRALDVGCARGFLVEALRELGIDAWGCDVSRYAVQHPAPGAAGHVRVGDLSTGLPWEDGAFELVSCLETLEHLEPGAVPEALGELRRVCGGVLVATIPSFGLNASGPDGHLEGKVREERLAHYRGLGDTFDGPVPRADLAVDADGGPVEGHLTIASYAWWTARFTEAGFERWGDVEQRVYADIAPVGLERFWNLYVLAVPGTPREMATPREPGRTLPELGLVHPLFEHAAAQGGGAAQGARAEPHATTA